MNWQGKELVTIGELGNAAASLQSREEAQEFMRQYRAENPEFADQNIGYLSGYYDRATKARIQDWCGVAHPIFGKAEPTPEQAVAAGRAVISGASLDDVRKLIDPRSP